MKPQTELKHLISLKEQTLADLTQILDIAQKIKSGELKPEKLTGKSLLILTEKGTTRTGVTYNLAAQMLGMHFVELSLAKANMHLGCKHDELHALSTYFDAVMYRAIDVKDVEFMATLNVHVIDGCSNKYHPSQALGDMLTMIEIAGSVEKVGKVAWLGIENNVSNTLALVCHKLGVPFWFASPLVHEPSIDPELVEIFNGSPHIHRGTIEEALAGASFVHTDTYADMEYFNSDGTVRADFASIYEERKQLFEPYQVSAALLKVQRSNAKVMHCMPCHVGAEISHDAMYHANSVIFQQAENRLHVQKAMLWWLFN